MYTLEATEGGFSMEIESEIRMMLESPLMSAFFDALHRLSIVLDISSFVVQRTAPLNYTYSFATHPGRQWNQTLVFSAPGQTDPGQTFDVPDPFKLSEYKYHRDIRDVVVLLITTYQVVKIEVTYP